MTQTPAHPQADAATHPGADAPYRDGEMGSFDPILPSRYVAYCWTIGAALATLLAGAWLILAPFALGYQPATGVWTPATANDVWCGALLVVVALARLLLVGRALLADLRAIGVVSARPRPVATGEAPASNRTRRAAVALLAASLIAQVPFIAAVWLIVAPWVMQTQRAGAIWSASTIDNLIVGIIVLGMALIGAAATLARIVARS